MSNTFCFPIEYPKGCCSFPVALQVRFNEYHDYLQSINCESSTIDNAKKFSDSIIESINQYFAGRVHSAYNIFEIALNEKIKKEKPNFVSEFSDATLFRARIETPNQKKDFNCEDLFHIKFKDRTKVQNQRFSISGLPCLYMSESLFACWVEMGRPSIDIFTAASIKTFGNICIFDLCKMSDILIQKRTDEINKYATFIHLVIASSITVFDEHGAFKPEYIIPQFIMQWLLDNEYGILGVKYYCTSRHPDMKNKRLFTNYAFPALSAGSEKFCKKLEQHFKVTRVMPGRCVQFYNKKADSFSSGPPSNDEESIDIAVGLKRNYQNSMFGIFETILTVNSENMDDGDMFFKMLPSTPEA